MKAAFYLLAVGSCLPGSLLAADSAAGDSGATEEFPPDVYQRTISENINNAAQWVDSFFDDESYIAEDATTKLRIRQSVLFQYDDSTEYKTRGNLSIDVPRTENRLRLFIGRTDDDRTPDSLQDTGNERDSGGSAAGLQYFARASDKQNLSLIAGIKVSSADLFTGPRYRYTFRFHDYNLRFTQGLRWYTGRGWESRTRFDYETIVYDRLFFRQTLFGRWREEDPGYQYELRSSLFQPIKARKAVEYQWVNLFKTHPHQHLDSVVLRMRYRQNFLRKWLFYEMSPQVAFRNHEDFDPKPGIMLGLEVVFGGKQFLKHHQRATDSD